MSEPSIEDLQAAALETLGRIRTFRQKAVDRLSAGLLDLWRAIEAPDLRPLFDRIDAGVRELADVGAWLLGDKPPPAEIDPARGETWRAGGPEPTIQVDAVEIVGSSDRLVRVIVPQLTSHLTANVAEGFARALISEARKARSPSGLILPRV